MKFPVFKYNATGRWKEFHSLFVSTWSKSKTPTMTTSIANDSYVSAWREKICESEGRNRIPGRISNYDERQISRSNTVRMSRKKKAIQRAGNNSYRNKSFAERLSGHIVEFWHCSDATIGKRKKKKKEKKKKNKSFLINSNLVVDARDGCFTSAGREGAWPGQRFGGVKSAERG